MRVDRSSFASLGLLLVPLLLLTAITGCDRSAPRVTLEAVSDDRVEAELGLLPSGYGEETFIYELSVDDVAGEARYELAEVRWHRGRAPSGGAAFLLGRATQDEAIAFWGEGPVGPAVPEGPVVLGTAPRLQSFVEGFFDTLGRLTATAVILVASPALTIGGALIGEPGLAFDMAAELNKVGPQPVGDPSTTLLTGDERLAEYERLLRDWNQRLLPWQAAVRASSDDNRHADWLLLRVRSRPAPPLDVVVKAGPDADAVRLELKLPEIAPAKLTLEKLDEHRTKLSAHGAFAVAERADAAQRPVDVALGPLDDKGRHLGDGADRTLEAWREHKLHPRRLDDGAGERLWRARRSTPGDLEGEPLFCRVSSSRGGGAAQWVHGFTRRFVTQFTVKGSRSTVLLPKVTLLRGEKVRFSMGRSGWLETERFGDALATFDGSWPLTVSSAAWTAECFPVDDDALARERAVVEQRIAGHLRAIGRASADLASRDYVAVKDAGRDARALLKELRFVWGAPDEDATRLEAGLEEAERKFSEARAAKVSDVSTKSPAVVRFDKEGVRYAICLGEDPAAEKGAYKVVTAWDGPKRKRSRPWMTQGYFYRDGTFLPTPSFGRRSCPDDVKTPTREVLCVDGPRPLLLRLTPGTDQKKARFIAPARDGSQPDICRP